jgi:hypothetical protein
MEEGEGKRSLSAPGRFSSTRQRRIHQQPNQRGLSNVCILCASQQLGGGFSEYHSHHRIGEKGSELPGLHPVSPSSFLPMIAAVALSSPARLHSHPYSAPMPLASHHAPLPIGAHRCPYRRPRPASPRLARSSPEISGLSSSGKQVAVQCLRGGWGCSNVRGRFGLGVERGCVCFRCCGGRNEVVGCGWLASGVTLR